MTYSSDEELVKEYLGTNNFIFTGPRYWSPLGLGSVKDRPTTIVYNRDVDTSVHLCGRPFSFRIREYPNTITGEWLVVDMFNNANDTGIARQKLVPTVALAIRDERFNLFRLRESVAEYGDSKTKYWLSKITDPKLLPGGRPAAGAVRDDAHARELIADMLSEFSEECIDGTADRHRVAFAKLEKIGEYLNKRGYGPMGKQEYGGRQLKPGLVSVKELSDFTGWPAPLIRDWIRKQECGKKIGRNVYITKRKVVELNPDWLSAVGADKY